MASEGMQKAIDLVEKSEQIALILPADANLDSLTGAEVLASLLEEQGKQVSFLSNLKLEDLPNLERFPKISSTKKPPKEFIVSLDTTQAPVAQLRYEKQDNKIDVIFSPKSSAIRREFVTFLDGKTICDCALALGIPDIESLRGVNSTSPEFFTDTPLINIDISEANRRYGEVNLTEEKKSSISEVVYDFAATLRESPLNKNLATLLLAGIINKTKGFKAEDTTADTLLTASELMRIGADKKEAYELSKNYQPLSLLQFFGRASIRTKVDEAGKATWSFLTSEDFEKTSRSADDLYLVIEYLNSALPIKNALVLLWQENLEEKVQAIISGKEIFLTNFSSKESGEVKNSSLRLDKTFSSFKEAEDHIVALLQEIL